MAYIQKRSGASKFGEGLLSGVLAELKKRQALKDAMDKLKDESDMALQRSKDLATFNTNEEVRGLGLKQPFERTAAQEKTDIGFYGQSLQNAPVTAIEDLSVPEDYYGMDVERDQYGQPSKEVYDNWVRTNLVPKIRARTAQENQKAALQALRNQGALQKQEMVGQQKASQQAVTERVARWRIASAEGIATAGRTLRERIANMDDTTKRELATNEAVLRIQLKNMGVDASEAYTAGQAYLDARVDGYMSDADAKNVAFETVAARRSVRPEEPTPTPTPEPVKVKPPPFASAQGNSVQALQDQAQELAALIQAGPPGSPAVLQAQKKLAEIIAELERKGVK